MLQIERVLAKLSDDPALLKGLREQGMRYARERLSWDAKAEMMTQILTWATGQGAKPDLRPDMVTARNVASLVEAIGVV